MKLTSPISWLVFDTKLRTFWFNLILDNGIVPTDWLKGNIIPIYKNKGRKEDPANYRPVTLLSYIGKDFTSILR